MSKILKIKGCCRKLMVIFEIFDICRKFQSNLGHFIGKMAQIQLKLLKNSTKIFGLCRFLIVETETQRDRNFRHFRTPIFAKLSPNSTELQNCYRNARPQWLQVYLKSHISIFRRLALTENSMIILNIQVRIEIFDKKIYIISMLQQM